MREQSSTGRDRVPVVTVETREGKPPVVRLNNSQTTGGNMPYEYKHEKLRKYRWARRMNAINKIADASQSGCAICGCPHNEILHIGHPEHRGGRFHRKKLGKGSPSRNTVEWVLRTPIEEVLEQVQLECPYCNAWHNRFKEYPPEEKQPKW